MCIETGVRRAQRQVEVAEQLFNSFISGIITPALPLMKEAVELGIDIDAVRGKAEELYADEPEEE